MQFDRLIRGKDKIHSWSWMKKLLAMKFYPLNCDELLSYTKQDYYWPRNSHLNYFEEPYSPPLKEELHVEENIVLKDYLSATRVQTSPLNRSYTWTGPGWHRFVG